MKKTFIILCLSFAVLTAKSQGVIGTWTGKLTVQNMQLTLTFHVNKDADGKHVCTMDSPDQSVKGVPTTVNLLTDDSLNVSIPSIAGTYAGKLEGNILKGMFTQFGRPFKIEMQRGEERLSRPQEPKQPFPYLTEEVKFTNEKASATFAGTLCYPVGYNAKSKKKVPVVLMVTGSGQENRNEEIFDHKPFLVLADFLARNGIASLRYDDRGTAESTGDATHSTMFDNAADALSGFKYLQSLRRFSTIGILGHSEGGCIAFILAAQGHPDFIVSLAGVGTRGDSLLLKQLYLALSAQSPNAVIDDYCKAMKDVYAYKEAHPHVENAEQALTDILQNAGVTMSQLQRTSLLETLKNENAWWLNFISTDMGEYVAKTRCPVMAINGAKDLQVTAKDNLGAIRRLLPSNKANLIKEYPDLNHLFQHCTTGQILEYRQIEETFSPEVMQDIVQWIKNLPVGHK